jgi:mannose-6-phosphate isomerase-like protein (cupin superfamily)
MILVKGINLSKKKNKSQNMLANNKYFYKTYSVNKKTMFNFKNINNFTIHPLKCSPDSSIKINNKEYRLFNKSFDVQAKKTKLEFLGSYANFIVAGVKKKKINPSIKCYNQKDLYKVLKPWGYEVWINGEKPTYALKKIFLKKNYKTSLQFHKKKIETNYLFKGSALLHYGLNDPRNKNGLEKVKIVKISKNSIINVKPYAIHRIEAKTNIVLYEVSTPHLNDVVRILDDTNRKDGRINSEHH